MPKEEDLTIKDLTVFQKKCNEWMKQTFLRTNNNIKKNAIKVQSSLTLSINFYQQVKFTRPLTLQDCGSPILLTASPTYWSDCEWEGDRLKNIYLQSEYQLYMTLYVTYDSHIHVQKYILKGVSRHEKRGLWPTCT